MESTEVSSFLSSLRVREYMWKTYGISCRELEQMDNKEVKKILIMCEIKSEVAGK